MDSLYNRISDDPRIRRYALPIASTLLGIQSLWYLNRWASQRALNNFTPNSKWDWTKELVVITGGSSGIGAAIVSKLASKGIKIVILDLNEPTSPTPPTVYFYKTDISSSSSISSTATEIRTTHGHPTILINNAGISTDSTILEKPLNITQRIFAVNHFAHYLLVKEFLPNMIKHKHGHVVTIASMASFASRGGNIDYAASKAAVLAFHDGLSQELALFYDAPMVRTTIVHPTWVATPMLQPLLSAGLRVSTVQPEEIADAVVKQLYSGNSGALYLPNPLLLGIAAGMKGWPHWMQEWLRVTIARDVRDVARSANLKSTRLEQDKELTAEQRLVADL